MWRHTTEGRRSHCKNAFRGEDVHFQDDWGCSPLQYTLQHPFNDVARILLDHDGNHNAPNHEGEIAVHVASLIGQNTVVKLLLEYSA